MAKRRVAYELTAIDKTKAAFNAVSNRLKQVHRVGMSTAKAVTGIGVAATGAAAGLGAFVKVNTDAIDRLGKTASKLGLNVELLQQLRFAADQTGIAQETLDMAMQRFIRRVGEAQNGTGEAKAAIEELGIELRKSDGSFKSTKEVLFEVADGLQNTEDASTRLRLAFKFFDSEGAALVNTLKGGSEGLNEFFQEANDLGLVIDGQTTKAFEKFADQTSILFKQIKTLVQYVIAAFLPVLQAMAERFSDLLVQAGKLAGGFKNLGKNIAVSMVNGLEKAIVAMAEFGNSVTGIARRFGFFKEAVIDVEAIKQKFENVRNSITEVKEPIEEVTASIENTEKAVTKLSQPVMSFISEIKNTDKVVAKLTTDTMKKFEDSIVEGLKNGKLEFKKFADFVIEQLLRIAIQRAIIAPITGKVETFFKGIGFEGGGFTGYGARAGGVDGKGGFPAILHPNETVIDHSKGQAMGATVNFNISTVDASGFDTLLASRKGMITAMISNAMNQRGKVGIV